MSVFSTNDAYIPSAIRVRPLANALRAVLRPQPTNAFGAFILLAGLNAAPALANSIQVNAKCSLVNAISAANSDAATGGCPAGNAADIVVLPAGSIQTLTVANNTADLENGLPIITSIITIAGNGSTIKRAAGAAKFRIAAVHAGGNLTLNDTQMTGGDIDNSRLPRDSNGGALLIRPGGRVTLKRSSLTGNKAAFKGGGVYNDDGTLTLINSTISGNSAYGFGGGLFNNSSLSLSRSFLSGNTAGHGAEIYNFGGTVSANDRNLFGHNGDAGVEGFTPGATDIIPNKSLAAILKPLAANGGATPTHLLVRGSPAINASPNDAQCAPKRDQRGVARPQGAACDIGAVEVTFCETAAPTAGCTVNGTAGKACRGTSGADTISGTNGADVILGLEGNDILKGVGGNDKLCGGLSNDRLEGGSEADQLFGGFGGDTLLGNSGNDSLFGEQNNDNLDGGSGSDKLNGGPGAKDTCTTDASDPATVGCEL